MITILKPEDISPEYLSDESRLQGRADSISFPENAADLRDVIGRLAQSAVPFTVQGARTGITGGAVPEGGRILNLSKMNRITGMEYDEAWDAFTVTVEPGLTLETLNIRLARKDFSDGLTNEFSQLAFERFLNAGRYFFPPDPTETTATVGGMTACNASGARSHRYGPVRPHVRAAELVLSTGATVSLTRGRTLARGREFALASDNGTLLSGVLPSYAWPPVKNAAGYFIRDNVDLLDVFIGQEGTLAVFSSVTFSLVRRPAYTVGVLFFFKQEKNALQFVARVRTGARVKDAIAPCAVEYFDRGALAITTTLEQESLRRPDPAHSSAVYVEADGENEDGLFAYFASLAEGVALTGEDPDANWTGTDGSEREALRLFRHAVPEAVNQAVAAYKRDAPGINKLGTDFAVPEGRLEELVALYRQALDPAGLHYVMFGHIGDNHLHVNILPRTQSEFEAGRRLYRGLAEAVVGMGGTVSAEHGIGKLKRDYLELMYGGEHIDEMKRLKRLFDPGYLLNRGNLFTLP